MGANLDWSKECVRMDGQREKKMGAHLGWVWLKNSATQEGVLVPAAVHFVQHPNRPESLELSFVSPLTQKAGRWSAHVKEAYLTDQVEQAAAWQPISFKPKDKKMLSAIAQASGLNEEQDVKQLKSLSFDHWEPGWQCDLAWNPLNNLVLSAQSIRALEATQQIQSSNEQKEKEWLATSLWSPKSPEGAAQKGAEAPAVETDGGQGRTKDVPTVSKSKLKFSVAKLPSPRWAHNPDLSFNQTLIAAESYIPKEVFALIRNDWAGYLIDGSGKKTALYSVDALSTLLEANLSVQLDSVDLVAGRWQSGEQIVRQAFEPMERPEVRQFIQLYDGELRLKTMANQKGVYARRATRIPAVEQLSHDAASKFEEETGIESWVEWEEPSHEHFVPVTKSWCIQPDDRAQYGTLLAEEKQVLAQIKSAKEYMMTNFEALKNNFINGHEKKVFEPKPERSSKWGPR